MSPIGIRGIGAKSPRTEARQLHSQGWRPERIADFLDEDPNTVSEWLYGKVKPRTKRSKGISPASPEQKAKVKGRACVVCRQYAGSCHPAHLIDRSIGGDDDPRIVVPLCPDDHRAYDEGDLDLLPYLEPNYRAEQAYAVELVGLHRALDRISNDSYVPKLRDPD